MTLPDRATVDAAVWLASVAALILASVRELYRWRITR